MTNNLVKVRCDDRVMPWHREPTLDEVLADPIVRELMARDGADPHEVRAMLHRVATRSDGSQASADQGRNKASGC